MLRFGGRVERRLLTQHRLCLPEPLREELANFGGVVEHGALW